MNYPYLAAGYYPLSHDPTDWPRDLDNMKKAGIGLVRTAEICCSWDQIEPQKGHFAFSWLDELFDLCEERNMQILLGTGTASPPYWLHAMYDDVNIVSNNGDKYPNNASYSWACIDHPGYLEECERYITTLVSRYCGRKGLFGYQIHNEIGFPFMPLGGKGMNVYCYCEHSVDKFRKWLENKYGNIEKLNHAYKWNATNERYSSFMEVNPPKAPPEAWSSVSRWIDWRSFFMDDIAGFVAFQNTIIKKLDNNHPTTTNIFFVKSQDPFGVRMGLDQLKISENVDFVGVDIYPGSGNKAVKKKEYSSMSLDMCRSIASYLKKDYAVLETESGPINGWVMGPDRNVGPADIWRNLLDAFCHGSKFELFQGFRDWDYQPILWGGLTDLDGNPTERLSAVEEIYNTYKEIERFGRDFKPDDAQTAIVLSKENAIIMQGIGQEQQLLDAFRGFYSTIWNKNVALDVITTDMLDDISKYKVLCFPLMACCSEDTAEKIERFVKNGGTVVAESRFSMLDEKGWQNHCMPAKPLDKVFGIKVYGANSDTDAEITYDGEVFKAYWHKDEIMPFDGETKILGVFDDKLPAVTKHVYGKGNAYYIGTQSGIGAIKEKTDILSSVLDDAFQISEVKCKCTVDAKDGRFYDGHVLRSEKSGMLVILNTVDACQDTEAKISFSSDRNIDKIYSLNAGKDIAVNKQSDSYSFETTLKASKANIFIF